jgi:AraC-like DNA-binding protein
MNMRNLKELLNLPGIEEAGITRHVQSRRLSYHRNNGYEICFSYSGIFTWEIRDGGLLRIRGNQMSLTPPEWEHRGNLDQMNPGHLLFLVINPENMAPLFLEHNEAKYIKRCLEKQAGQICRASREVIQTARSLESLWQRARKEPIEEASISLVYQLRRGILLFIHQALESFSRASNPAIPVQLQEILKFISLHLDEKITIKELSLFSKLSQTNIFHLFKEYAGQSPNDYIQYLRCLKACDQLTGTDKSITKIAYDLGFSSSQYFSQVFKKYTGFTPLSYRSQREIDRGMI